MGNITRLLLNNLQPASAVQRQQFSNIFTQHTEKGSVMCHLKICKWFPPKQPKQHFKWLAAQLRQKVNLLPYRFKLVWSPTQVILTHDSRPPRLRTSREARPNCKLFPGSYEFSCLVSCNSLNVPIAHGIAMADEKIRWKYTRCEGSKAHAC